MCGSTRIVKDNYGLLRYFTTKYGKGRYTTVFLKDLKSTICTNVMSYTTEMCKSGNNRDSKELVASLYVLRPNMLQKVAQYHFLSNLGTIFI